MSGAERVALEEEGAIIITDVFVMRGSASQKALARLWGSLFSTRYERDPSIWLVGGCPP